MLAKFREKYTWIFVIASLAVFRPAMSIGSKLGGLLEDSLSLGDAGQYLRISMCDLFAAAAMILILYLTNRLSLLSKKGVGFVKSIPIAAYPLGYVVFALITHISEYALGMKGSSINPPLVIIMYTISMFLVGVAEELNCRAIVAETLLEHFGTSKKGIWLSCIISGLLFGCMHLFNLEVGNLQSVLVQSVVAGVSGITLAAIYFRSGNIKICIFVHMLTDFAGAIQYGVFSSSELTDILGTSGKKGLLPLILLVPQIITALVLLRNKKIGQIKEIWPEIKD